MTSPTNDDGAPCGFCWEMLFAYSPSCQTCKLRPFGSAPCLDDIPDYQECPGSDRCPNGSICNEILMSEWPLARLAVMVNDEQQKGGSNGS